MKIQNNKIKILIFAMLFLAIFIFPQTLSATHIDGTYGDFANPAAIGIGDGDQFLILATTAFTSDGLATFEGNLGLIGAAAFTAVVCANFGTSGGRMYTNDVRATPVGCKTEVGTLAADQALLTSAVADFDSAYTAIRGPAYNQTFAAIDMYLHGTFGRGVYKYTGAPSMSQGITLRGSSTDIWLFQVTGAKTQAAAANMVLKNDAGTIGGANGPQAKNILWAVDGACSQGANSKFIGVVMCTGAFSTGTGSTYVGRAYTRGAVTTIPTSNFSIPASSSPPSGTTIQPMLITKAQIVNFPN
jgi:hypothetical protein